MDLWKYNIQYYYIIIDETEGRKRERGEGEKGRWNDGRFCRNETWRVPNGG